MRLAVGITTMLALAPPETCMKRSRMWRSFSLFSAPPIGTIQPRVSPSGILLGIQFERLLERTESLRYRSLADRPMATLGTRTHLTVPFPAAAPTGTRRQPAATRIVTAPDGIPP